MTSTIAPASAVPFDVAFSAASELHRDASLSSILEKASAYFSLLSEPSRLRIIQAICHRECSVQQIVEQTGLPQPNVSRHLALLHRSGVLSRKRVGTSVFYQVSDATITELCRIVCIRMASAVDA
jgi:DNA-binding transcriptional ArsR family regulator